MKKTMIKGRKCGLAKVARAAGILTLTLALGACASKRGDDETQGTTIAVGDTTQAGSEETATSTKANPVLTTLARTEAETEAGTEAGTVAETEAGTEAVQPTWPDSSEYVVKLVDFKVADYVDMSKVKDLKIKKEDIEVDKEDIESAVLSALVSRLGFELEEKNRPVQNGDTVNIDFEGSVDGVKFDGGTAQGSDLVIGSGQFIPGFEEGIIGKELHDIFDLPVTFPEDYFNSDLAGKKAVFKITVNKISAPPEKPEDAVIKEKSNGQYETYQAFYDSIADQMNLENRRNVIFDKIMDAVEMKAEHEALINEYVQAQLIRLDQTCQAYGMDRKTLLEAYDYTEESYVALLKEEGKEYAKQKLAILGVCQDNGIEFKDDEIEDYKKKLVEEHNLDSVETLMSYMTPDELQFQMFYDKFIEYIDNYKTAD